MIYFDNSATTRPYDDVLDAFVKINKEYYGNPSSLHNWGGKAERLLAHAREQIAHIAGVKQSEIYFTSGGTEGNNLAIKGTAFRNRSNGNHIITTAVEHPSVYEAFEQLKNIGFDITYIPVDEKGIVSVSDIQNALTDETILVSVIHVNNEVGTIQPIHEIGQMLTQYRNVLFHVDHVQGAGKVPIDLYKSHVDLCTFSAHKFHGLKGTGFLFIKEGVHISPILSGGGQENNVRSGTENTGGIVAMAKAYRIAEENRKHTLSNLLSIRDYLYAQLSSMQDIMIHTPLEDAAPHIINFTAHGQKSEVLVHALEEEGIIVSTTSACSSRDKTVSVTLKAMGRSDESARGAVRISLSYENTLEEAKQMIKALQKILERLNNVMRRK